MRMKELGLPFYYAVTATSRPRRASEVDGRDYHFIEKPLFEKMIAEDGFLEWANVYGNLYGVPAKYVEQAMSEGKDALVKVDIQGTATIKKLKPEAVSVFIAPPSMDELERRLAGRKTESEADLKLRLETAQQEMEAQAWFDHVVVSRTNRIDEAIAEIRSIVEAEQSRDVQTG